MEVITQVQDAGVEHRSKLVESFTVIYLFILKKNALKLQVTKA